MSDKWDQRFLDLAAHIAGWSKDPSTKVGCVVVGEDREIRSTGFNGFPRGISDDNDRLTDREKKYPLICHAEENAIMHAARIGVLWGDIIYRVILEGLAYRILARTQNLVPARTSCGLSESHGPF